MSAPVINRMVDMPDPSALGLSDAGASFVRNHDDLLMRRRALLLERASLILDDGQQAATRSGDDHLGGYVDALAEVVEHAQSRAVEGTDVICLPADLAAVVADVVREMNDARVLDRVTGIVECLAFTTAPLDDVAEFCSRFDAEAGIDVRVGAPDEHEWERFMFATQPASWVPWTHVEHFVPDVADRLLPVVAALRATIPADVLDTGLPLDPANAAHNPVRA